MSPCMSRSRATTSSVGSGFESIHSTYADQAEQNVSSPSVVPGQLSVDQAPNAA